MMAQIEASALNAFQGDIARNPSLAKEAPQLSSASISKGAQQASAPATVSTNRFGQSFSDSGESETLVNGKKRALETISKAFERKSKWLEAKTAEGTTYYWNKDTLETRHEPPKTGFLSIAEQNQFGSSAAAGSATTAGSSELSHARLSNQYLRGGWKTVKKEEELHAIDLQLPTQDVSQIMIDFRQQQQQQQQSSSNEESKVKKEEDEEEEKKGGEDKADLKAEAEERRPPALREKTVADLKRPLGGGKASDAPVSFKKRTTVKRSIRSREADD